MYRKAEKSDLDEIVRLNYESFLNYPLFTVLRADCESEKTYENLIYAFMNVYIRSNFGKATYIVREVHGKIAAFALLFPPDHKRSSVLKDFLYGAIKIVSILGIRKALSFNRFLDASTEAFEYTVDEEHWHLDQFAVSPSMQGQSVGSKMMQQAVLPFLRRKNAKCLTLITNKEINRRFYDKNGFIQVFNNEVEWEGQPVDNWGFKMDL